MSTHHIDIRPFPVGSSLYYALLYATEAQRQAIALLMHFFNEMHLIATTLTENSIAKTKLAWWAQEITQTYKRYPQHPLTHVLVNVIKDYSLPETEFQRIIQAMIATLDNEPPSHRNDFGAKFYLIACVAGFALPPEDFIVDLGKSIGLINALRHFPQQARNQEEDIAPLIKEALLAKTQFQRTVATLQARQRSEQLSMLIFANIYFVLLDEIAKSPYQIVKHKISLTPLRKCWIAWRTKAREQKSIKKIKMVEKS